MRIEYEGRWFPEVGDKVTVHQYMSGTCKPYYVSGVTKTNVIIKECDLVFYGTRYFDSIPDEINPPREDAREETLSWSRKHNAWVTSCKDRYPGIAKFNELRYEPYLD